MPESSSVKATNYIDKELTFENDLKKMQMAIDSHLDEFFNTKNDESYVVENTFPAKLYEAMKYSVANGGKRIRAYLCYKIGEALGKTNPNLLRAACSVEMIHAYSLIHDDLPAMDNADLRRGKPSNHKVYGEATAILAGDALLTLAFEWMSSLSLDNKNYPLLHTERSSQCVRILAECAGMRGMVGGQIMDLEAEGKDVEIEYLVKMHEGKTSALIQAPLLIGFLLSADDLTGFDTLKEYGKYLGLLFQVVDDILDVKGDASKLGKETGKDAKAHKATYPAILGLEESKQYAKKIHEETINLLDKFKKEREIAAPDAKCDLKRFYQVTDYILNREA